jgi:ATP-dependent Clp endopeptidase proteolytic subunit ClpP
MRYVVDSSVERPIMLIDRHIGYDETEGFGIDGADFARELMVLDGMGKTAIDVWINSPGGIVLDGYNIYNAILQSKTKVNTVCVGMAASIAAVIFQAGRERIMCDYGILMYHNPFGSENSDALRTMRDSIVTMISQRCGMTEDETKAMMNREPFMLAQEALDKKLCDSIQASADLNKKRMAPMTAKNDAKAYFKEAHAILNTILPTSKKQTMDFAKIANHLKLNPAANEDAVMEAIKGIENRASAAERDLATAQNRVTALEGEKITLTGQLTDLKNKQEAAEKEAKKVKAEVLVVAAAKLGTIKNEADTIARWTALAENDYDGTKALIETLPVNKTATRIENGSDVNAKGILENQIAIEMANVRNRMTTVK